MGSRLIGFVCNLPIKQKQAFSHLKMSLTRGARFLYNEDVSSKASRICLFDYVWYDIILGYIYVD